ncbi:hypothetical protein HD554DRAFT_2042185 [Boletus coccyginus]|nr:hypothetical protein HD554DRAFT_2042185 [Boletus coccyginus]
MAMRVLWNQKTVKFQAPRFTWSYLGKNMRVPRESKPRFSMEPAGLAIDPSYVGGRNGSCKKKSHGEHTPERCGLGLTACQPGSGHIWRNICTNNASRIFYSIASQILARHEISTPSRNFNPPHRNFALLRTIPQLWPIDIPGHGLVPGLPTGRLGRECTALDEAVWTNASERVRMSAWARARAHGEAALGHDSSSRQAMVDLRVRLARRGRGVVTMTGLGLHLGHTGGNEGQGLACTRWYESAQPTRLRGPIDMMLGVMGGDADDVGDINNKYIGEGGTTTGLKLRPDQHNIAESTPDHDDQRTQGPSRVPADGYDTQMLSWLIKPSTAVDSDTAGKSSLGVQSRSYPGGCGTSHFYERAHFVGSGTVSQARIIK